jgi:hypothetical protein
VAYKKSERLERIRNGLNVKTDCFKYDPEIKNCTIMTELICLRRKCSFYKPKGCDKCE